MYSNLMWQTGAIFFAGSFVLLGIIISAWEELPPLSRPAAVVLFAFVSVGILWFWRFRLYYRYRWYNSLALLRTRAIEKYLVDNFEAKNELEWEDIPTRIIENWITEMDVKTDEKTWKGFLEGLKNDLKNPPKKVHIWINCLVYGFAAVWVVLLILSIIILTPAN